MEFDLNRSARALKGSASDSLLSTIKMVNSFVFNRGVDCART